MCTGGALSEGWAPPDSIMALVLRVTTVYYVLCIQSTVREKYPGCS